MPIIYNRETKVSVKSDILENWVFTYRRMKDVYLTHYQLCNNWKWIKKLNMMPKAIKLLKESVEWNLYPLVWRKMFGYDTKFKDTENKNRQKGLYYLQHFYIAKEIINRGRDNSWPARK